MERYPHEWKRDDIRLIIFQIRQSYQKRGPRFPGDSYLLFEDDYDRIPVDCRKRISIITGATNFIMMR